MTEHDLSDPVQARAHALELLREHAARAFAKTRWNSITMCVAQYWDDEANDAVHDLMVMSVHPGPAWPHECGDRWSATDDGESDEACDYCQHDLGGLAGWHDNGWVIRPFEPFCREGATQNDDPGDAYLPYAVARRTERGVAIEVVGKPVRPWLLDLPPFEPSDEEAELRFAVFCDPASDIPRQVLADWLQERGDPRGLFITEQLAGADGAELLAGNELSWAGEIGPVCDSSRTVFRRGFPAEVRVCFRDQTAAALATSPAWTTVERLEWHDDSVIAFPDLPVCTVMHGVPAPALPHLGDLLGRLVELSVRVEEHDIAPLAVLHQASALRSLRFGYGRAHRADVPWWRLHQLEVTSREVEDWLQIAREHGIERLIIDGAVRATWTKGTLTLTNTKYGWSNHDGRVAEVQRYRAWFAARGLAVRMVADEIHRGAELVQAFTA